MANYHQSELGEYAGINVRSRDPKPMSIPKAVRIGYFSLDANRQYHNDGKQLKYYVQPKPCQFPLNLNSGMDNVIRKPVTAYNERLKHLLSYISDHFSELCTKPCSLNADFICYRGTLKAIMGSPYDRQKGWRIMVTHYRGTIYICKDGSEQINEFLNATDRDLQMCSWGFKMEQYILSDSPEIEPNTTEAVDENMEFSLVLQRNINGLNVLYGAEMDGVQCSHKIDDLDKELNNLHFVEIKTQKEHLNHYQRATYEKHKSLQWWCQSFLVDIEDHYIGIRDDEGNVHKVQHRTLDSLRHTGQKWWNPNVCLNFLAMFLRKVRDQCQGYNCPYTTTLYTFVPQTSTIYKRTLPGRSEYSFLPDWYLKCLDDNKRKEDICDQPPRLEKRQKTRFDKPN